MGVLALATVIGPGFIVTFTLLTAEQPANEIVTSYAPDAAAVAALIDGFWTVEVNPRGPVQEYVAPVTAVAVKFKAVPAQIGELEPAVVTGAGITATNTELVDEQPAVETVTV